MRSFIYIDSINVKAISNQFLKYNDWDNSYTRNRINAFEVHKDTAVIPLMWSMNSISSDPKEPAPRTEYWDRYFEVNFFEELHKKIYNYCKGYPIRVLFTLLKANGKIPLHEDTGPSLTVNKRIHIPIVTSNKVIFKIDEEEKNIKTGEIYEINNQGRHGVFNNSDKDRIHLIVDWHEKTSYHR